MKTNLWKHVAIVATLAAATLGAAWIRAFADSPKRPSLRRVESITIDPAECKLSWTVSRGEVRDGGYAPKNGALETYEISFHQAEMTHDGVTFKFSEEEAVRVHGVMLAISRYTAESVDWFDQQKKPVERAAR